MAVLYELWQPQRPATIDFRSRHQHQRAYQLLPRPVRLHSSTNNNYGISSTYQKIWGRHTFKVGLDVRRWDMNYFQNNQPGGNFNFDNVFTGSSAANPGSTGKRACALELGYVANSSVLQISPPVYQRLYYQGYFGQDTWQVSKKLTPHLGLRWELPGTFLAGHGWEDVFNPKEANPIVNAPGAFDLVNTPQHPSSGATNEVWTDFEPRLGLAYRLTDKTVMRAGWGRYVVPNDVAFTVRCRCRPASTRSAMGS